MRANMMLESLQTVWERYHVSHRDRVWLLNKAPDVAPHGSRAEWERHRVKVADRPYFFNQQPVPKESAMHLKSRTLARKAALSKTAISTVGGLDESLSAPGDAKKDD